MNTDLTMGDVLNQLGVTLPKDDQLPKPEDETKEAASPWYVRLFVGVSAWIAALFFIGFLFSAEILQEADIGVIVGLVMCGIAIGLNRFAPRNDFFSQLGLALSLAGQLLFIIGLFDLVNEIVLLALPLIILEIGLIWLYKDRLHRFISTLIIIGAILAVILDLEFFELIHILIFNLAAATFLFYGLENRLLLVASRELVRPLGYAVALSLLGLLILPTIELLEIRWWWLTAILLLSVLLFLVSQIAADLELPLASGVMPWLLGGCLFLFVPAIQMPGILAALIILLLAFWRNNRLLLGLAAAFLLFYLGAYYYWLEWSLLTKSFALMGGGAIMFLLRYVLLHFTRKGSLS